MLGADGFLPAGRRRVTVEQFREAFVDAFPTSKRRPVLFENWLEHRAALQSVLVCKAQWIDGSYVTCKTEPGDIDVVTLIDGPAADALDQQAQTVAGLLVAGPVTKQRWGIDSYPVAVYPEEHPSHSAYLALRGYWDWWLGRVRDDDEFVKGYLEVLL